MNGTGSTVPWASQWKHCSPDPALICRISVTRLYVKLKLRPSQFLNIVKMWYCLTCALFSVSKPSMLCSKHCSMLMLWPAIVPNPVSATVWLYSKLCWLKSSISLGKQFLFLTHTIDTCLYNQSKKNMHSKFFSFPFFLTKGANDYKVYRANLWKRSIYNN